MRNLFGAIFLIGWVGGQIFRWPGWPPLTLLDIAVLVLIIASVTDVSLYNPLAAARGLYKNFWVFIVVLFGSWLAGLRLFLGSESLPGLLYLCRILAYLWVILRADILLRAVKKWIFPTIWVFVALSFLQYVVMPDTRFLLSYGWDEHYYRMIGTVLDPNYLGAMLGVILLFAWSRSRKWLGAVSLVGLGLTFSRASWLSVVAGFGVWIFLKRDRLVSCLAIRGVMVALVGVIGVLILAPKPGGEGVMLWRSASINQRVASWKEGIEVWRRHPVLGVGFNNYAAFRKRSNLLRLDLGEDHAANAPSSSFILLLATTGVVGIGVGVIWAMKLVSHVRVTGGLDPFWSATLVLLGVHAVFNNTLFYTPVLGLLALLKSASRQE